MTTDWRKIAVEVCREALKQCKEHNEEYHHQTPTDLLEQWRNIIKLAEKEEKNELDRTE